MSLNFSQFLKGKICLTARFVTDPGYTAELNKHLIFKNIACELLLAEIIIFGTSHILLPLTSHLHFHS